MPKPSNIGSSSDPSALTRREFLSRTSALGAAGALTGSLLSDSTLAATPNKGGRVRIASEAANVQSLLEAQYLGGGVDILLSWMCRNNLVEINAEGEAVPELAETWEVSADARKWVFELRRGIEFHNGKSLDAQDVVYSIKHHGSKSGAGVIVQQIKKVRADGKHTVVFELKKGNADFAFLMSDYHLVIAPAGTKGKQWRKAIGTGGYVLREWKTGERAFATRNPNYWKEGRAHFDEAEVFVIGDPKARLNALRAGEVDIVHPLNPDKVELLKRTPNMQVVEVPGTLHVTLPMRTDQRPFDNNDVRLALKYAIDREAFVKTTRATLGNDHPIAPSSRYHADELPQRQYDPDKARFHLEKAGLSNLSVELSTADFLFDGAVKAAVLYAEQAARAGIEIKVRHERDKNYWSKVWRKKPWCMAIWGGRATPDWMFAQAYAKSASWNETFWQHERFNRLLEEARAELNEAKRREMYVEMQRLVRDEGGVVIPSFSGLRMGVSAKLRFGKIAGNWPLDDYRITERWWFG